VEEAILTDGVCVRQVGLEHMMMGVEVHRAAYPLHPMHARPVSMVCA
jgi:hypothetical protein